MIKENYRLQSAIFGSALIFLPIVVYAQMDSTLRSRAIEETLRTTEAKTQSSSNVVSSASEKFLKQNSKKIEEIRKKEDIFTQKLKAPIKWTILDDVYLILGLELGYINGNTAYDFNHHTSELEFPMDNWMIGGNFSSGYKNLSFNTEIWTPLENYAGFEMKDKDWDTNGALSSYTKSKAEMDAIIWDANARYDFYEKVIPKDIEALTLLASDKIKIGALLGYRYERFDYDLYDLYYPDLKITTHSGEKIGTYKIKYHLPYLGLATDILSKNYGFGMNIKYSFNPTAEDVDNHLLRGLTFYGDYDKHGQVFMGSINAFWRFRKDWKFRFGADTTFIRIDGITWEQNRNPTWDKDQSTDAHHWILWSGIEYKF